MQGNLLHIVPHHDGGLSNKPCRGALAGRADGGPAASTAGVCALNIEAMQLMKRGAPPGGANPFGIPMPPSSEPAQQPAEAAAGAQPGRYI